MQLQLETAAVCHARCVFCEYPTMQRSKGFMDLGLSRKILDEAAGIEPIDTVTFTGLGEPLLDRHLEERIRHAKGIRPAWETNVYTVGTHLTHERAESLAASGLDILYVSLNAVTAAKRKAITKLDDFDKVVEQIRYAMGLKAYRVIVKAVMSKDLFGGHETEMFLAMWGGPTNDGGNAFLHLEGNWAGDTWKTRIPQTEIPCHRALGQIMVLWDGRVSLCCFDGEGKEILGDLNTQTIREVYNGGRALFITEAHNEGRRNEIAICAGCTGI